MRAQFRELRGVERRANAFTPSTTPNVPSVTNADNLSSRAIRHLERRLEHNVTRNQSFQALDGQLVRVNKGIDLDLTSTTANITLGSNLFKDAASVTINVGGKDKVVTEGSQVSAAEYVAVKQLLSGGGQTVVLDNQGRATGGNVDLGALTQGNDVMRASDLVVPVNVTTIGDFSRGSDFRLLGDLTNGGTVLALTSGTRKGSGGALRADDIVNQQGALLQSNVENLLVDASGNFTNAGTVSANGNITIQAAGTLTNSGSVRATGDVGINSNNVVNSGSIASSKGNVNFDGADTSALLVNNTGGTVSAERGAINFRAEGYTGASGNNISGGDFLSQQFNTHSGQGTSYVDVGNLTGTINQTGSAAHVQAATDNLELGTVCLTGDPTYRNTAGDITIAGNFDVNEALTVIAEGDITVLNNVHLNTGTGSKGYEINLIAGADITAVSGGANIPTIPPGVTGSVTINGNVSPTGGSVIFGSNTSINTRPVSPGDGGNVNIFAFEGKDAGSGRVDIGQTTVTIGANTAGINGGLTIIAGANSGDAIKVGAVLTNQSSFATGGFVNLTNAQPISNGGLITWGPDGQRTTTANLVSGADLSNGNIVFTGGLTTTLDGVIALAGGDITLTNNTDFGGDLIVLAAGGSLTADAASQISGSTVYLFANNDIGSKSTPLNFQASELNVESATGSVYIHSELGGVTLTNGEQSAKGDFVLTGIGSIDVQSTISATNVSLNAQSDINFNSNGKINATNKVDLIAVDKIKGAAGASVNGTDLTLSFSKGTTELSTKVASLTVTAGDSINIHNAGALSIKGITVTNSANVDITAAGLLSVDGAVNATTVSLLNNNGGILINGDIKGTSTVSLDTSGGTGGIDTKSGLITSPVISLFSGTGGIGTTGTVGVNGKTVSLFAQATGGDVKVEYFGTDVLVLTGNSTGNVNYKVTALEALSVGIVTGNSVSATGDINIFTSTLNVNGGAFTGNKITVDSVVGNLFVSGGANQGTFNSTVSTEFISGGSITTSNQLNFNGGDALLTLRNNDGVQSVTNSGILNGDKSNDLIVTAALFNMGTVQNFKSTIIVEGNTIANSIGDVVLPTNLIFNGQDLAIIAKGNITGTLSQINLSSTTGDGGNITILAGVAFTPPTAGQVQSATPYTITGASTTGGKIDLGTTKIDTSSTAGKGGLVTLAAFAGTTPANSTIAIGDINTKGSTTGGSVNILGSGDISVGKIDAGGAGKNAVISITAATPSLAGNIVVTNGVATGLANLTAGTNSAGSLTLKDIDAKTANLKTSTGAVNFGASNVFLQNFNLTTTSGNYVSTSAPNFQVTNVVLNSGSGNINFGLSTIQNLTSNVDTGTVRIGQNNVNINVLSATGTAQNLELNSLNFIEFNGTTNLGTGTLKATSNNVLQGAISNNAAVTAGNIIFTAANGGVNINETLKGDTISLTAGGANSITTATGKTIDGGALTINELVSSTSGLSLSVDSLKIDKAGDFKFTQTGNLQLLALVANSVTGTVNSGNVTTGATISLPTLTLTVNNGSLTVSNPLTATTSATLTAQNDITTDGTGLITTPLLDLKSNTGSIGTAVNLVKVDSPDLKLEAATGNIFVSDISTGAVEVSDPLTTTGDVAIETVGSLETRAMSANNIVLSAGSYVFVSDLTATNLIDITQTTGDLAKSTFTNLTSPALKLSATNGSVGTSATPFAVGAATKTISGFGKSVFITSANTTGVTLSGGLASGALGNFEFKTTGPLTVSGNVESTNGKLLLQTTAGLLQIANGVTILGDSEVNIINTGSVDDIDRIAIGSNVTIKTDITVKTPGGGNVNIIQGKAAPGKVRKGVRNVVQNLQDGGKILFGGPKNAFIANAPNNIFNAIGANIYISTDQTKRDGGLTFGGGVTITADPPVPAGSAMVTYGLRNEKSAPTTMELNLSQPVNADTASITNVALNNAVNAPAVNFNQSNVANSLLNLATNDARMPGLLSDTTDNSYIVSYEPTSLEVDAPVCTDMDLAITGSASGKGTKGIATMKHSECITMNNGKVLFMPAKDTTVVTPKGTVKIAANSVAMVMVDADHLSVYDINDSHKRSVTVETAGRTIALSPGRHVLLTNKRTSQFAEVNPMEAMMHRSVSSQELGSDSTAFTSEFSLPAAVQVMKPLKAIFASDNAQAKKVAERVLKTSAVIMQVSGNVGPFQQHVRPRRVAFN